uniref:PCI domain-containing protein n=1 Tax=Callithrix jacchus TaxID=9483 RepID=A0A8I3WWA9_CALJA
MPKSVGDVPWSRGLNPITTIAISSTTFLMLMVLLPLNYPTSGSGISSMSSSTGFSHSVSYRCKTAKKSEEEIDFLRSNPKIWNVHNVLNVLHCLVDKSNINRQLESMYSRVPECQVTTYYYVGFAYLMMRRYQDAIWVFANVLLYIRRTKGMFQRTTYKYEMIIKQNEQMHALLAIALTMYPMHIDESIHLQLREKYGDSMLLMQKGDPQVYEEPFSYSCPKFLSPVVPNYDNVHPNYHKEPFLQQLNVFADKVQQQAQLSTIRSFLKLYTTMPVAKLAGFLDLTASCIQTQDEEPGMDQRYLSPEW